MTGDEQSDNEGGWPAFQQTLVHVRRSFQNSSEEELNALIEEALGAVRQEESRD